MKADHFVKVNGIWYAAGEEIPAASIYPIVEPEKPVEQVIEEPIEEPVEKPIDEPTNELPKINKSKIVNMNVAGIRQLATEYGIEDAEEMTGNELKRILLDKLGLI